MWDSHAHLNDPELLPRLPEILASMKEAGVEGAIVPGYDLASSQEAARLAAQYSNLYAVVGIHPHEASTWGPEAEELLRELLSAPKVVGLGEIGLDYHYDNSPREIQREAFRGQLALAREYGVPVVIHARDAYQETLEILKEEGQGLQGVFHCFQGAGEAALRVIRELGFLISLGGPVTFKNAKDPVEVAARVPLSSLLIETDSPYLTPHPHRGKGNLPSYLPLIEARIREIRGEAVGEAAAENLRRLFNIPGKEGVQV